MKILNVNKFYYVSGGSDRYYLNLGKMLVENDHEVVPFAMKDTRNFASPYSHYFVENIDYGTRSFRKKLVYAGKIIYSREATKKIGKLLDDKKPDVAHLHIFQHQLSASILPQIKRRGIPIVYTVHDYKPLCPNYRMLSDGRLCEKCRGGSYYHCVVNKCTKGSRAASFINTVEMYFHRFRRYYELIDIFITPSEFQRRKMIEHGIPEEKLVHIPNFVQTERRRTRGVSPNGAYLLYAGRLSEEKGVETLVAAMKHVTVGRLLIAGAGPRMTIVADKIRADRLQNVDIVGLKSGEELQAIMSGAFLTVMPSVCYENNPMAVLESFACAKPVVGARIGGIPELIGANEHGLTFEPRNPLDLARKINYLFANPSVAAAMGKQARKKAADLYSPQKHYEQLAQVYERVLA